MTGQDSEIASSVCTPSKATPVEKTIPLAAAIPIRKPVKEPGPRLTATPSTSDHSTPAAFIIQSTEPSRRLEWVISGWTVASASRRPPATPPRVSEILPQPVAVSMARIRGRPAIVVQFVQCRYKRQRASMSRATQFPPSDLRSWSAH